MKRGRVFPSLRVKSVKDVYEGDRKEVVWRRCLVREGRVVVVEGEEGQV